MLADIDRFCGQIAAAIHSSELQLYATLGLIIVLSASLPAQGRSRPGLKRLMAPHGSGTAPVLRRLSAEPKRSSEPAMLSLVVTLLIIALIAGILGFGGIAGAAVGIAKIVFFVALVLFLISLLAGGLRGGFGRRL
jgi:uncharacterized membrane protein YtjA (UPF0391 family)